MDIDCPSVPPIDKNGWTTIEIGKSCEKIVYYPEVNALLCYHKSSDITSNDSKETSVNVLEITTGQILKTFHFASNIDHVMSLMKQKKVLIGTGNVLGLTREVSGCLYLDTCLQLPSSTGNQNCILELSYEEVKVLQPWFEAMQKSKELTESLRSSTDKVVTELREAMKQLPNDKQLSESASSHLTNIAKKLKWHSVKLCMTIDDFLEILEGIYAFRFTKEREEIFGDRGSNESTDYQLLPILFAVIDRLACLHASGRQLFLKLEELVSKEPNSDGSHDIGVGGFVPGMCSEYARRLTFITWPHYSYKWAKPDSMAKAGFYHTKGAHNGKDGVQCFKCRINLVKWEASDEPWNEHEQHSPNCLFLRGEPTHNVPIANTIAFSPAVRSSDEKAISVISNSNHPFFVASSSADGCINVWNCCAVPKLYFNFSIDASDEQIANVFARYTDSPSASSKHKLYNKDGQEMKGIASMLPSFFMEEVSSDPTAPCPESSSGKGPKKSATSNDQHQRTLITLPDPDDDCVITCLSGADEAGGILINQKMETADNPTVTFPLEEEPTSSKMVDCVQVTSLALSGFEGVNPSPLGCIVVVGCKVADPRSPLVSSTSASTATVDRETCLLVYKVDCSDLRATKTALFHQPPDHTNLLAMDDKYSNFASEIAASHPMHSTIDDMMMIGDLNEDGIHMEIELAHSPEMLDPADAPSAMVGDPLLYNDYTSYAQTATANVYESEMLATGSSDFSGVPNKLYNLLDAKLMQAMPLQAGSEITHIIMEQYGTQPFFYVIASKDSSSAVYVFLMEKIFNSFHLRPSMNNAQKQQNVIKMHCNQQFAQGVIKHALLLPLWSCNLGEYPLFVTTTTSSSDLSSVLLCVSDNDDIVLFKLPKLECVTLQTEADKNLFGGNKIKSVSFDCGSDSLCILTSDGKVHFVEMRKLLGEQDDKDSGLNAALNDVQEDEMDCGVTVGTSSAEGKFSKSTASNQIPASVSNTNAISIVRASGTGSGQQQQIKQLQHQSVNRFDYLADAKGKTPDLNTATLDWISQLSECVPLTPRFLTGLVPSGWVEVEQEQQQRKFSEHLPSSGGSVLHTRTFRVNKESSSCVTVLELQLPFAVVLGHVDVKIQLKKATNVHDLTATLSCPSEIAGGVVSRDTFSQTNRKLLGPVPLKLFRFGNQGLSINVSLTGPKLYLMKHRVLFLELGCKGTTSNSLNLHEVSITVRKMKKPPTARTIAQVQTVLEDTSLVEKLLAAVIEPERSVHTVGDTKEFFMSGPTVRQTALTSLTWLLYTHATDSGNSRDYLASFYSKCFNGNGGRMMRDLVQVCFIEGDRSLAHLFARFLAVLLKFLVTLQKQERQEFFDSFKQTLLDMLPKMVTCASHGGMHWFQLFFYQVVVADTHVSDGSANSIQSAFSICLDLLDHLVDCSESSQDTFTKTLQNKFRLFCNPFEQKILTFPMQTIIAHDSPKQGAGGGGYSGFGTNSFMNPLPAGGGKWYMSGGGPLGAGGSGSTTNYVQQLFGAGGPLPTGSESVEIVKNMIQMQQLQSSRKSQHFDPLSAPGSGSAEQLSSQSFVDLFVPLNFVGFTLDNYLIGFLEAEPLRVTCVEASDGVKMHQISSGNEVVGGHSGQHTLVEYEDTVNEPGMTPTLVQLINVAAASASAHNQHMGGPAGSGGAYNSMFSGSGWGAIPPGLKHYNLSNQGAGSQLFHLTPGGTRNFIRNFSKDVSLSTSTPDMSLAASATNYCEMGNKSYAEAAKSHHGTGGAVSGSQAGRGSGTPVSDAIVGSIGGSLTHTPQPQYMMIDNLHPGVRKFVVLDFGRTIVLSDVFLGPCPDLASITLDCWVKGEALDCLRVATSLDISTDALALTDLQPALHCRYLKITVSGKYGPVGSATSSAAVLGSGAPGGGQNKVLLPINTFYGHSLDTEYELIPKENKVRSVQELQERHLKTLAIVYDDLLCRYSLASNHLKSLIAPHAASISSNSQHDKRYVSEVCSNCRVLQRQLNVVTRVIERVKNYYSSVNEKQTSAPSSVSGKYGPVGSATSSAAVLGSGAPGGGQNKVLLPINTFYGHSLDTEYELIPKENKVRSVQELQERHLKTLAIVYDDLLCRYSLASNHLKSLIAPHAASISSNSQHDKRYVSEVCSNCRVLQRQLNVVTRVIERVKNYYSSVNEKQTSAPSSGSGGSSNSPSGSLLDENMDKQTTPLSSASTTHISHSTRFTLLSMLELAQAAHREIIIRGTNSVEELQMLCPITEEQCDNFMNQLCIKGVPNNGILALTLLHRVCHAQIWWPRFVSSSFVKFFSESTNSDLQLHVVKIYITLLHLAKQDKMIDDVILSFVTLLLNGVENEHSQLRNPIVPPVGITSQDSNAEPMETSFENNNPGANSTTSPGSFAAPKCNWSQLSAILMIISQGMSEKQHVDGVSYKWDFFPNILNADFLKSGMTSDKHKSGSGKKEKRGRGVGGAISSSSGIPHKAYSLMGLMPKNSIYGGASPSAAMAAAKSDIKAAAELGQTPKHEKEKKPKMDMPPKMPVSAINDVRLPVRETQELIRRLLCLLPELIRSQSTDFVMLLCRVVSLLSSACDPAKGTGNQQSTAGQQSTTTDQQNRRRQPIRIAALFPGNLLSNILLNAFVVTTNQLITYAVQSLIVDVMEAELGNRGALAGKESSSVQHSQSGKSSSSKQRSNSSSQGSKSHPLSTAQAATLDNAAFFGSSLTDDSNSLLSGSVVGSSAPAVGSAVHSTDLNLHSLLSGDLDNTTVSTTAVDGGSLAELNQYVTLSNVASSLVDKQMDFIQEMLNPQAPIPLSSSNLPPSTSSAGSIPIFGQSQQYSKKGSSSGSGRSKESVAHPAACSERSGDCLDARLEAGILHHSERWLNQLQAAYTSSVYQNLACLNFNPPKRPIVFNSHSESAPTTADSISSEETPLTFEDSKRLLRNVFDELLSPRNLPYLDLKEVLLCWYNISNLKISRKSENGGEKQTKVRIGMSSENMAQIFNKLTVENTSDSVVWTLLFRCLIVTSLNEGPLEETERPNSASTVRSQSQSPMMRMQSSGSPLGLPQGSLGMTQGAPDNLLTIGDSPSTVIIKNLIRYPVLDTFLSGSWSPGGTRSEQCRGPVVTGIFGNFLDTLNESSKNRALLGPLMMKLLKSMCEFSGAIKQGYGPVDCQVELVNKMLEFQCQTQDPHIICGLVNVICKLGYDYVSRYRSSVTMTANTSTNKGNQNLPNICLTVFGSGVGNSKDNLKPRSRTSTVSCNVNSRETLLKQLFKLAQTLVKTETGLGQLSNLSSNRSVADYIVCDDQISVINTLLVTLSACVLPSGSSEAMASDSFTLKHIENFVEEFMSVGGGTGNKEHDSCSQSFEQRTLGDYILQLLMCVESSTRERKLLHQRLVQSLSLASPGQPPCFSPSLSQPVLCFFIHLLRNIDEVKMFSSVGGLQVLINKIIANSETGPGFNFSCQPLDILNRLTQCFQVDSLQLQGHLAAAATQSPNMPPQNIGPKAIITCVSDPGAQLPDILLQENPPHKRARSAAWTYHFPPAGSSLPDCTGVGGIPSASGGVNPSGSGSSVATDQPASCCLCITLPTLSIVHYVEIKMQTPAMGVSHMAPSSVSMDLFASRDSSYSPSATPTCVTAPLIVSRASGGSASCIQLRPHEPRLCGSLLLTFYPPPESSSIGLSHIAIYARPVLSDMTQPQSSTDHIMTSLHAFKLIEYCMEMQLENITKRQNHYSSSFANISSTQSQHHHTQLSGATATTTTPDSMMMLGAIFSESFTPLTRDRLLTACLSLLTQNSAQLFFPCLKRTVLCLATLPLLPSNEHAAVVHQLDPEQRERETADCQAETIQHVIVILLDSFVSSTQPLTAVYVDEVLDLLFSLCTHSGSQQVLLNRISVLVSWLESNLISISQCTTQSSSCLAHLIHAIACVLYQVHALYMFSLNTSSGNSTSQQQQQQQQSQSHSIPSVVSGQHFANVARYVLDAGIGINISQSHSSGIGFGSTTMSNVMTSSSVLKKAFDWLLCSYVHMYPSFLKSLLRLLGCPELQTSSGGTSADSSGSSSGSGPMSPPSPIPVMGSNIMNEDSRQQRSFLSKQWWANLSPSQLATLHHCLQDAKALDVFRNFAPVAEMFSLLMDLSISDERSNSEGNVKTLIRLLDFLTNMSENNPQAKRWLGQAEKTRFWSPLLTSLCYDKCRQQCLSLTDAALKFFETVVDDNQANQRNLAEIVSQLVSQKKDALNSFVKQLILNVFLKEERITVVVHSAQDKLLKWPSSDSLSLGHPKYGIGHRVVFGKVDADAPLESLIADILDPTQVPMDFLPVGSSGIGGSGQKSGKGSDAQNGSGSGSQVSKMKIKGNKLGGSMVLYSPLSQKLSKIEQKKKTLEKIGGSGSKIPFAVLKHLSKIPNSNYWTAKVKSSGGGSKSSQEEQRGIGLDSNSGGISSKSGSSNVKLWRCMHKTLGSDWLPNAMSVRQLMLCLKQLQSRDVEEGFVKLDLIGVPTEQFEMEMEVAIAETLDAMVMDSTSTAGGNYGGQQQNRPQHLRPPQVFASVGGFTKLALRIPVLNPDFVKLMCTNSKDSASSGTGSAPGTSKSGGGMGFPGSEKLDLSEWILIDQHTFGGQAGPDGAGGAGGSGKNSSYNVIDVVESSDEENYMDTFDMEDGIGGYPGSTGYGTGGSSGGGGGSASSATSAAGGVAVVAPHCLALLGLTLQLPLYVEVLLREERKARFLLRILLGVSDVGDSTTSILSTPEAKNLSTLPLEALKSLFDEYPVNTELGLVIRQQCVDAKILDLLFGCLAVLTHRNPESQDVKSYQFLFPPTLFGAVGQKGSSHRHPSQQYHSAPTFPNLLEPHMGIPIGPPGGGGGKQQPQYWAKGTGFGTGSMQSGWNMEQSLLKKSFEEQNCCAILQVLASFISGTEKKANSKMETQQIYHQYQMPSNSSFTSYDVISASSQMQACSSSSQQGSASQQGSSKSHYAGMFRDQSSMSSVGGGQTLTVVDLSNFSCRLHDLISQSCLLEVLNSYLTNDSILDMDRHVAVHQAVLDCIRAMVSHEETAGQLIELMLDEGRSKSSSAGGSSNSGGGGANIFTNLTNIRDRHSIYHTQLNKNLKKLTSASSSSAVSNDKSNQTAGGGSTVGAPHGPDADGEGESGVNKLSEDLEHVHALVTKALERYRENTRRNAAASAPPPLEDPGLRMRGGSSDGRSDPSTSVPGPSGSGAGLSVPPPLVATKTPSEIYCEALKPLQFLSYKMIKDTTSTANSASGKGSTVIQFALPFHFVTEARMTADTLNTKRAKRLAQESVSLSSALPLDYSSSVFIRYDEDRLDIMKVLITGPSDTPYGNGCFVFDIFFPTDYPNTPLLCNFTTTGGGTVRFNPNLYNDGKVCLSILNTWHGRPEEKWNAQTSNLLQVLVSIQSLILVSEPYFNEPGYERSRNTPAGQENSEEYSANIKQATVKWAMLNQLKSPTPCFKDVIHAHFYLKKNEILQQVQEWLTGIEVLDIHKRYAKKISSHVQSLKKSLNELKVELKKLSAPPGIEEEQPAVVPASQEPPKIQEPIKKQEPIGSNRPREPKPISRPSTNIAGMHCATESAMGPLMTMPLRKYSKVPVVSAYAPSDYLIGLGGEPVSSKTEEGKWASEQQVIGKERRERASEQQVIGKERRERSAARYQTSQTTSLAADTPDGGTKGADGNAKSSAASSAVPNFSTESPASQQAAKELIDSMLEVVFWSPHLPEKQCSSTFPRAPGDNKNLKLQKNTQSHNKPSGLGVMDMGISDQPLIPVSVSNDATMVPTAYQSPATAPVSGEEAEERGESPNSKTLEPQAQGAQPCVSNRTAEHLTSPGTSSSLFYHQMPTIVYTGTSSQPTHSLPADGGAPITSSVNAPVGTLPAVNVPQMYNLFQLDSPSDLDIQDTGFEDDMVD